ncbi:MAG: glycosyltransferase family 4 protein, partial [Candidatus Eisenbacteria bacterium]|nr:glycosyltransferase family 4 protein [Candidatus Eisenbacteria bacterium]
AANYPEAKFIMVGGQSGAEPDVFEQARDTAAKLPNVEFCGAVPAVEPYLDKATILLNTSRMEGFPTTFLEAWVRGIPTVSYFDPDGLTAKHGMGIIGTDQKSIMEGVGRILEDENLRGTMGAIGRQYVMDHHTPDVVAERVLKVMEQAIEKARKA